MRVPAKVVGSWDIPARTRRCAVPSPNCLYHHHHHHHHSHSQLLCLPHPFRSLTDLDVSSNRLRGCLCGEVGLLPRLRTLNLRGNRLGALPPGLAGCSALVELFAGGWLRVFG